MLLTRRAGECWSNSPLPSIWDEESQAVPLACFGAGFTLSWRGDATTPNAGSRQVSQLKGGVRLPAPFPAGMRGLGSSLPLEGELEAGLLTHFKTGNKSSWPWHDERSSGLSRPWLQRQHLQVAWGVIEGLIAEDHEGKARMGELEALTYCEKLGLSRQRSMAWLIRRKQGREGGEEVRSCTPKGSGVPPSLSCRGPRGGVQHRSGTKSSAELGYPVRWGYLHAGGCRDSRQGKHLVKEPAHLCSSSHVAQERAGCLGL